MLEKNATSDERENIPGKERKVLRRQKANYDRKKRAKL